MSGKLLEGKIAVVTGGARGIGKAIAHEMAKHGAGIAIVYANNEEAANETRKLLESESENRCACYKCDVSDYSLTKELVSRITDELGSIDILVNNAGIVRDNLVISMSEADFDAVMDTNLKGAFNMIKHIYPAFIRRRAGRIINITSVSGMMGNVGQANYSAAKAGMIGLTKTVAKELAGRNITCNAIAPGFISTDMTGGLSETAAAGALQAIPMKRMGLPEEVAHLAVFLASGLSAYITGEVIKVDGGLYI